MKNIIKKIAKAVMLTIVLISAMVLAFMVLSALSYSVIVVAPYTALIMPIITVILTILTPFRMVEFLIDFELV